MVGLRGRFAFARRSIADYRPPGAPLPHPSGQSDGPRSDLSRDDSKTMAQHGIDVVGFGVPHENPAWNDTFIYVLAVPSREEANGVAPFMPTPRLDRMWRPRSPY